MAAAGSWNSLLQEAVSCVDETRFFDGVQKINVCMEEFEKTICDDPQLRILKEPMAFGQEMLSRLSDEQKASLAQMHDVRGDLVMGLGASKRAFLEYTCAAAMGLDTLALKNKMSEVESRKSSGKVPCTILTGFLGSGKTTLLNHILSAQHGKRVAVIENEFGEVGIDDALVHRSLESQENIVEMNNGCICCTVRGDLIAGLKKLIKKSITEGKPLDAIMIETTGLADPAPVAQTFFADDYVRQKCSLDGILTVVDAKHIIQHLDEEKPEGVENEAVEQLAFADRILLNKCDLVDADKVKEVEGRIKAINATVPIRHTQQSEVDMDFIFGIDAFSLDKVLEMDDSFLDNDAEHQHDSSVSSVGMDIPGEVDPAKLDKFLNWIVQERGLDMFRYKGVLAVQGKPEPFVFQGIHMMFTGNPHPTSKWKAGEARRCKMTFIGKNLNRDELTSGFMACVVASA